MRFGTTFFLMLLTIAPVLASSANRKIHERGFGPVVVGMSTEEASGVLQKPLNKLQANHSSEKFAVFSIPGVRSVYLHAESDRITSVGFAPGSKFTTEKGIGVGSKRDALVKSYASQVELRVFDCAEPFEIYTYRPTTSGRTGIEFTVTSNGIVQSIVSGDLSGLLRPC